MGRRRAVAEEPVDTGVGQAVVRPDPRHAGALALVIDGNVHGVVDQADPARLHLDYQARLLALVEVLLDGLGRAGRVAHLGGGAFAIPRALAARREGVSQVVVERSAAVIKLAQQGLGLRATPDLEVVKGDGRAQLRRIPDGSVDVLVADAFVGLDTPAHMATVEFYEAVARVLAPDGWYVVNLVDEQPWSVLGAHASTAGEVWAGRLAVGSRGVARLVDPGNVLLVAGHGRLDHDTLGHRLAVGAHPSAVVAPGRLDALARLHRPRRDSD